MLQLYAPTNAWEEKIENFEKAARQNSRAKGAALFICSSSMARWENLLEDFPESTVINRGSVGSRLAQSLYYIDQTVLPYRPRMIILYDGENDLAQGATPQRVFADYKEYVRRVKQKLPDTSIAFSIKPSLRRRHLMASAEAVNEMIKAYASEHEGLSYIDVYTPMIGLDGQPRLELFDPDGVHLSEDGYRLWRDAVAPHLGHALHLSSGREQCGNMSAVVSR